MKYLLTGLIATSLLMFTPKSNASELSHYEVNHFELMVNNLKMLYLTLYSKNSSKSDADDIQEVFTKFYGTREDKLVVDIYLNAPFEKVTSKTCNDELNKAVNNLIKADKVLPKMIGMASYFDLKPQQIEEIVQETRIQLTLTAKENSELSVLCSL